MSEQNDPFHNYPIEFKEINPSDFPNFSVNDKVIIQPDANGYINDALQGQIDLFEKNTVVVNAAVGQGKTYSIIDIVKRYYDEEEDYLIFIASPFVSLVEQYVNKVIERGIPSSQVYDYNWIGATSNRTDPKSCTVHVLTANALLGNPGEDAFINSPAKREYINSLAQYCRESNKKVIFIYDEIHDAIHNFKEEYIFNLWKWKDCIVKNYIISATYNEASKVVIKYLAELTDNKVQIIESERVIFPEKQSKLYLHYNRTPSYKFDDDTLCLLVKQLIDRGKDIDILSFSSKLAKEIHENTTTGVGQILFDKYGDINLCISDLQDNTRQYRQEPENRYNPQKCNVGTNFKTGVSIEKENHAFIIILPPSGARDSFKSMHGIFTDGINSIIQSLARQRIQGEIHIMLPPPHKFNYETLPFDEEEKHNYFKNFYENIVNHRSNVEVDYIPVNSQQDLINLFYENELKANVLNEIEFIGSNSRSGALRLEFPSLDLYKLYIGEKYLYSKFEFFGKDLSSYVTYSAITNQFVNCRLESTFSIQPIFFTKEQVQWKLQQIFNNWCESDNFNFYYNYYNDLGRYLEFKGLLFNETTKVLYRKDADSPYKEIKPNSDKDFEVQLLAFTARSYRNNREIRSRFEEANGYLKDGIYTRGDYFRSNISHSLILQNELSDRDELINAYLQLNQFRVKILEDAQNINYEGEDRLYHKSKAFEGFIREAEIERFRQMLNILIEKDYIIRNKIFEYSRTLNVNGDIGKLKESFYKYCLEDFFEVEDARVYIDGQRQRVKLIKEIALQSPEIVPDFLSPLFYSESEAFWENMQDASELISALQTNNGTSL
ncbi:DEAD/DEAH box helicase family protein [Elizabethkingia anophelis]|nr:DEAD/DEAH box helicase family protein [Elizabethkingia anophelis]MCT3824073.1 DEAD/DEAH box helicase family protein [Elizabethkingia anophelis]MCT3931390.1 DEAD/DEAH box helicase family protein [Elizabethkingia anophelis]MCT4077247.1 DEAD/DEAH box helicase family protein [Elizabethkingia anophelis]MCT4080928.1 DEAD/DEAH box helicase family protein [Elizabethkingia anophelis]